MKKLLALSILLAGALGAQAQRQATLKTVLPFTKAPVFHTPPAPMAIKRDTLTAPGLNTGRLYCDTGVSVFCASGVNQTTGECIGYVGGTNEYGDREKLSKWGYGFPGTVTGVDMFLYKHSVANPTTPIQAVVYGSETAANLPDTTDRSLSTAIPFSTVQTGWNRFVFPNTPIFADSFFVGLVIPQTAGDTIALLTTRGPQTTGGAPCAGPGATRSFERWSDGSFSDFFCGGGLCWNLQVEFLMEVHIQYDDAVATKHLLGNLVKVSPVPAINSVIVNLPENIKGATTWQLMTSDGRVASQSAASTANALVQVERGNLPAGVYTLRLNTVAGPVTKRVVFAN